MASNGISTLTQNGVADKEARQIAKLDLAAVERGQTYNIELLPTRYTFDAGSNINIITDNINTGGLQPERPWL